MKSLLAILLVFCLQTLSFSQKDSASQIIPNLHMDNNISSITISQTDYPKDSLTYDQYVGHSIAGYTLADGWRIDTINGGYNKELYTNPYIRDIRFEKQGGREMVAFRYKDGKLFTGKIEDTLTLTFTPPVVRGHLYGKPYYESENITAIFRADCVNGVIQGRGVLAGNIKNLTFYKNMLLAECNIVDGEMIGQAKFWDVNSINYDVVDNTFYIKEKIYDYMELKKLLHSTEVTYVKGYSQWTDWVEMDGEGKVLTKKKTSLKSLKY